MNRIFSSRYLDEAADNPDIQHIKQRSYDALIGDAGGTYADIGCGPGLDTVPIALRLNDKGRVFGLDADAAQLRAADARAAGADIAAQLRHLHGDACALPFDDQSLDGCRCERLLQHLAPVMALRAFAEAMRATKPGGRLVYIDTDWPSFSVHCADAGLERLLTACHLQTIANPYAARGLADLFAGHGLADIRLVGATVRLAGGAVRLLLKDAASLAQRHGWLAPLDAAYWFAALAHSEQQGRFYAAVNMLCCVGTKPG
ncbi:methyltransferase domain-containing protein [Rugamonas sp. CCM 8940]|uniref:methyltransferase domain-containing protein n=1 Tax=Rugamonas sp. CCM 8940 TaxID=2765359 RepID=UPI0018F42048|nr:methyltransferase domain-containing protein [Rugamonas sp. CCM 8940]